MGKYESVFDSDDTTDEELNPEEAVAAVAVVAAAADSGADNVDAEAIEQLLGEIELFADYSAPEMSGMVKKLVRIARKDGLGALLNAAVEFVPYDLVLTAFEVGILMVAVDGFIPEEEEEFVSNLQQELELSDEEAQMILDDIADMDPENFDESEEEEEEVV